MATSSRQQIEQMKKFLLLWARNPIKLKIMVLAGIFAIGFFLVDRPLVERVTRASRSLQREQWKRKAAKELNYFGNLLNRIRDRFPADGSVASWQKYVYEKCSDSDITLTSFKPGKTLVRKPYKVVILDICATGMFEDIVDFMDRIERGERLMRLDKISLERGVGGMKFQCQLTGLVNSGA